jgi:alpha/beta hydrolase family protein
VDPVEADVMIAVQQPLSTAALGDVMTTPAWKNVPTWYAVSTNDEAIPPDAERMFAPRVGATTIELPSSHVSMVSHLDGVAPRRGDRTDPQSAVDQS